MERVFDETYKADMLHITTDTNRDAPDYARSQLHSSLFINFQRNTNSELVRWYKALNSSTIRAVPRGESIWKRLFQCTSSDTSACSSKSHTVADIDDIKEDDIIVPSARIIDSIEVYGRAISHLMQTSCADAVDNATIDTLALDRLSYWF